MHLRSAYRTSRQLFSRPFEATRCSSFRPRPDYRPFSHSRSWYSVNAKIYTGHEQGDSFHSIYHKRESIILPNIGDTGRRCANIASQCELSDEELARCHDACDDVQRSPKYMTRFNTAPMPKLSPEARATVTVPDPSQRPFVRLFHQRNKEWTVVRETTTFSQVELESGLKLGIDARETRRPDVWDGCATVRFAVRDGNKEETSEAKFRVAPVLVHNHLDRVEQIWATAGSETRFPWVKQFSESLESTTKDMNMSKPHLFGGDDDPWAQDFVEPGYVSMPGPNGPVSLRVHLRSSQDSRKAGRQVFEKLRGPGVGAVQHFGGARDEINSMGNLECTPPFTHRGRHWPVGRIIMGKHGKYQPHILPYLRAQEAQDPILLDTAWLYVGHVDEFIQFLPAKCPRGWVVVVADPAAGLELLKNATRAGYGDGRMYSRKADATVNGVTLENVSEDNYGSLAIPVPEETISDFLSNSAMVAANLDAALRIEANLDILKDEAGIGNIDILRLAMVFNNVDRAKMPDVGPREPDEKLAMMSTYPATINGVVLTGFESYLAPKPWGPIVDGKDIFEEATKELYGSIGWKVKLLDNWNSHHCWDGEVHCATNTVREMNRQWWV